MKFILFLISVHFSLSAPVKENVNYDIKLDNGRITYESNLKDQSYTFRVLTNDGATKFEKGHLEDENLVVKGRYEFRNAYGFLYTVEYVADKNGYHPRVSYSQGLSYTTPTPGFQVPTTRRTTPSPPQPARPKGIDPALLCSLAGSGVC